MIKLDELSIMDLIPDNISNSEVEALSSALDRQLKEVFEEIVTAILLPRIDELPEEIVDLLAWQMHVDFYEPIGLNLNKKRGLVKNSLSWHKRKGTKSVLEEMIGLLYTDDYLVQEWFEYGGEPYYFRISIGENASLTEEDQNNIISAVKEFKNTRSWMEGISITKSYLATVYTGSKAGVYSYFVAPVTE